jgi:hypothetical protein
LKENIVLEKAYKFALRIVEIYRKLTEEKREYVLSKICSTTEPISAPISNWRRKSKLEPASHMK